MDKQNKKTQVVIIGGGIIGVCAAYSLAQQGVRVTLFEKGALGAEQSSLNWGWVRTLGRDYSELRLAQRSIQLWQILQTQIDVGFKQTGILYVARTPKELSEYETWLTKAKEIGLQAQLLNQKQTMSMTPNSQKQWYGGLYSQIDGVAEPQLATKRIAELARALGAEIIENCAVRGIEQENGKITGVVTEKGPVAADQVLLAGGCWSRLFCANLGIKLPQIRVIGSVLSTTPLDAGITAAVNTRDFTIRKRADGGYTISRFGASEHELTLDSMKQMRYFLPAWWRSDFPIKLRLNKQLWCDAKIPRKFALTKPSPFEQHRQLQATVNEKFMQQTYQILTQTFPQFAQADIHKTWAGFMDVTPDSLPIIAPIKSLQGFYIATGFSGHGFGIAPAVGELLSQIMRQATNFTEGKSFSLERFS